MCSSNPPRRESPPTWGGNRTPVPTPGGGPEGQQRAKASALCSLQVKACFRYQSAQSAGSHEEGSHSGGTLAEKWSVPTPGRLPAPCPIPLDVTHFHSLSAFTKRLPRMLPPWPPHSGGPDVPSCPSAHSHGGGTPVQAQNIVPMPLSWGWLLFRGFFPLRGAPATGQQDDDLVLACVRRP